MALDPLILPALVLIVSAVVAAVTTPQRSLRVASVSGVFALLTSIAVALTADADPLPVVLSLYTALVAAVVAGYSRRHLDGDVRARRYSVGLLAVAGGASAVVVSDNLVTIAVAWVAVSIGIAVLFGHHSGVTATDDLMRRWRWTAGIADVTLIAALAAIAVASGTVSMSGVAAWAEANASSPLLVLVTALLLVAASARSGLWPFSRWLPLSVVAPAPVSALLHAGVVNAPVVLLIGLTPVWSSVPAGDLALVVLGFGTALAIFPRKLVRPDVKTRLAWSTAAQMGFMIGLVAVGAPVAAVVHMILHGLYKATAFLGAGTQISELRRPSLQKAGAGTRVAGAGAGLAFGVVVLSVVDGWSHPIGAVTLLIALTAGGYGLFSLQARWSVRAAAAAVVLLAVALVAALPVAAEEVLGLLPRDGAVSAWAVALVLAAAALIALPVLRHKPVRVWAMLHRWSEPTLVRRPAPSSTAGTTSSDNPLADRSGRAAALVREQLVLAGGAMPPSWSWQGFIAANPLDGLVDRPFEQAAASVASGRGWATLPGHAPAAARTPDAVDRLVAGWLAAWTDEGDTAWPAPQRQQSFWTWFRSVGVLDPVIGAGGRQRVHRLPDDPADVVVAAVVAAGESVDACEVWLRHELLRLPGWAGYLGRRGTPRAELDVEPLLDLLAVRAAVRYALQLPTPTVDVPAPTLPVERAMTRLKATESAYRVRLLQELADRPTVADRAAIGRADADVVFCIDPRSEPVRRHLEERGHYRTVGFAGFFGFAVTTTGSSGETVHHPVPLDTAVCVHEPPREAGAGDLLHAALKGGLDSIGGGFAAVDFAALTWTGALVKTVAPGRSARPDQPSDVEVHHPMSREMVQAAEGFLRMTGLVGQRTAPVVVVVGHGSTSVNNPGEAAFDCGACGGQRGGLNAALAAQTLNDPGVRAHLRARGVDLPDDTVFVAAEHDTGRGVVTAWPSGAVGTGADERVGRVLGALNEASAEATREQGRRLPLLGTRGKEVSAARVRSADWATVRHEWGLAGNAAFIAAPRELTRDLDLEGRVFLHDYDPSTDTDMSALTVILTAPLVVAQWINAQYYFSTLDPENLGSGSKTAHNPVGGIGVLSGPAGDLRHGLAEQSVRHGGRMMHEPLRLMAVVAADVADIESVVAAHPSVQNLVTNEWLTLCAIDVTTGAIQRVTGRGRSVDVDVRRSAASGPDPLVAV